MADKYKQSLSLCAFGQSRPPTANDDASKGFSLGSIWSYEGRIYKLKNPANGAAEWFNSSQRFQQFPVYTVATEEVDLGVQTIQGVNQITSLFTAQADPADNGFYSWGGSSWAKPTFPFGVWLEEYDMLSGCLFTAVNGTETGKGYVLNNGVGNFEFIAIGGTGGSTTDLSGIPTSTATANTLSFFDADKKLISATDILLGTLGIAITKEFDLAFNGSTTAFTKTHDLNNDKAIHYTIQFPDTTLVQQNEDAILEYTVTKTATTITITFAVAPSTGTGYLTVTGIQKEAIVPPEDEGFPYTLPLTF